MQQMQEEKGGREEMTGRQWVNLILGISLLALCSIQDMKRHKIRVAYPLLWGIAGFCLNLKEMGAACLAGSVPGICLMLFSFATGGGIGLGDGLLLAVVGLLTGLEESLWVLLGALLLSSALSLGMLVQGKWNRKHTVPFVPFLLAAYVGVIVCQKTGKI